MWWGTLETVQQYFHLKDKQKQFQGKQCMPKSCTTSQQHSSLQCQWLLSPSGAGSALQSASFPFVGTLFPHKKRSEAPVRLKMYLLPHAESHLTSQRTCSAVQQMQSSNATAIHCSLTLGNTFSSGLNKTRLLSVTTFHSEHWIVDMFPSFFVSFFKTSY